MVIIDSPRGELHLRLIEAVWLVKWVSGTVPVIDALLLSSGCPQWIVPTRIARKMVARTIDRLGPQAALIQIVDRRPHLLAQIDILMSLEAAGIKPSQLDF